MEKKEKVPVYKKWWFWVIIVLVLFGLFGGGSAGSGDSKSSKNSSDSTKKTTTPEKKEKFGYNIEKSYVGEYGIGYYIEGTVTNNTDKDYTYVSIEFICYDASGNNIGTALDNTNNLLANQTWKYKASFLDSDGNKVDHCDYHKVEGF